ncbi:geraniol 8-hydroxylase-like [Castanea sativa]|uniref:geraniol 8-hydroxylase-like n=1 Tax=Castanea sativa TaxID=21020 RepID=UPI003F6524B4
MTELPSNPDIMAKAKQELGETIGFGRSIEEKDIPRLPYLQTLLKETMRLHPTAPLLLPHRAEMDVEVCGYTIPKHTQVFMNAWAIARDPMYWDKPTQLIPERFRGNEVDFRGTNFSFIPFGYGRWICPGLTLAIRMLSLLLASLIHRFDWRLLDQMAPEDIDTSDKFGITMQKVIPLVAIPVVVAKA